MSKITFRADDDLVERVERLDASKSEIMREALRSYLDERAMMDLDEWEQTEKPSLSDSTGSKKPLDEIIAERVDAHLNEQTATRSPAPRPINLTVTVDGPTDATISRSTLPERSPSQQTSRSASDVDVSSEATDSEDSSHSTPGEDEDSMNGAESSEVDELEGSSDPVYHPTADGDRTCDQCGEDLSDGHVYCPNCGEKTSRRVFCECGDELRTHWAFCPGCGRRTPAADVL